VKKILFLIIVLFSIVYHNAMCYGFLSYSFSYEYAEGENSINHSFGFEYIIDVRKFNDDTQEHEYKFHNIGIFIKNVNNPTISLKYNYYLFKSNNNGLFFNIGPGINLNIGEYSGISPEINGICSISYFKFNLFYRYNLYSNNKNTHEFGFTISSIEIISTLIGISIDIRRYVL